DPNREDQFTYARQSRDLVEAIPLSNPTNIILEPAHTAQLPFIAEAKHTWCYFYEKAESAYQQKDWKQVLALIDEAQSLGYQPQDAVEWLSYIEAQAFAGHLAARQ